MQAVLYGTAADGKSLVPLRSNAAGGVVMGGDVNLLTPDVPLVVSTAGHSIGHNVGGLISLSGMAAAAGGGGILQDLQVDIATNLKPLLDVLVFHTNPAASTFTDRATAVLAPADKSKLVGFFRISDYGSWGANIGQALQLGKLFELPGGTTGYAALVAQSAVTFAGTGDVDFSATVSRY